MNKIGIHALVWVGGWSQNESRQAIAGAAETGYDLIEVPLLNPKGVDVAATAKQLAEFKIGAATSLGLAFDTDISSADKAVVARGEALLNDALGVCRDIGSTYMGGVIFSALGKYAVAPTPAGRANCVGVLSRLAAKAKASGITLGLEAVNRYESNLINTGRQAMEIIAATGADNIVVHLDSYHMNIEEGDFAAAIEACGKKLGYFHVGESHRGYLGTGSVDFRTIFRTLARTGYEGPITFESFSSTVVDPALSSALAVWRNLWTDSVDLARRARQFIDNEMDAARRG
jgi:D-psicose/D-tagatose/L-ribulose 3-epimerase